MTTEYGRTYPGSGGARNCPVGGGARWYPHPRDIYEEVPVYETVTTEHEPGFFGRLFGRESTYTEDEVLTRWETRRRPDNQIPWG